MNKNNELAITRKPENMEVVKEILGTAMTTCSFDDPIDLVNIINGNAEDINDLINKPVIITDVMFQESYVVDEETGEVSDVIKTLMITEDGTLYGGISSGIAKCWKNAITVIGEDFRNWAYEILIRQEKVKRGNMYTLEIVSRKPKADK